MSRNTITAIIDGVDKLSPKLAGIGRAADALGAKAVSVGNSFSKFFTKTGKEASQASKSMDAMSVFMGNMYTKAFDAANAQFGRMKAHLSEAADLQTENIAMAGQFAGIAGISYGDASDMMKKMNVEIGKIAADLPGSTQQYKSLNTAISDTLITANTIEGVFDQGAYEKQALGLTESVGLLTQTSKELTNQDVQLWFGRFVAGASESELRILKMAERMPALQTILTNTAKELHGESVDIKELTEKQRVEIFQIASKQLVPPEALEQLRNQASSQIEGLKTALFDQNSGVLGFLRDTDATLKGNQSVMNGLNDLVTSVLGENGLFSAIGKTLESLGIEGIDPMAGLYTGIQSLISFIDNISKTLNGGNLMSSLGDIGHRLGYSMGIVINQALDFITSNMNFDAFVAVGAQLAGLFNEALNYGIAVLNKIDWNQAGRALGEGLMALLSAAVSFIAAIDWGDVMSALAALGKAINDALVGLVQGIASGLAKGISSLTSSIMNRAQSAMSSAMSGMSFGGSAPAPATTMPSAAPTTLPSDGKPVGNSAFGLNVESLFSAVRNEIGDMPLGAGLTVANTAETILNPGQRNDLLGMISSLANKAELGNTKPLVSSLLGALNGGGGIKDVAKEAVKTFEPHITINLPAGGNSQVGAGGLDVDSLVQRVLSELENQYQRFEASYG